MARRFARADAYTNKRPFQVRWASWDYTALPSVALRFLPKPFELVDLGIPVAEPFRVKLQRPLGELLELFVPLHHPPQLRSRESLPGASPVDLPAEFHQAT